MAERLRSAIESLFNVRDEANGLATSAEDRRRRRNEFVEALRSYGVPIVLLLVAAAVIAVAAHFLVLSLVSHILMPVIGAAIPGLANIQVVQLQQFITYLLYAAIMIGLAIVGIRTVLAKPLGYVRERTKNCPACGMTVLESAAKCRYCGTAIPARRAYGPLPASRAAGPTLSSSRTSADRGEDRGERPPRRGRRGGRRRSGRSQSGPGGAPTAGGSTRPRSASDSGGGK